MNLQTWERGLQKKMNEKVILTDCDGVLLDWAYSFDRWMNRFGYRIQDDEAYDIRERYDLGMADKQRLVRMFNESATIRKLPPLRDAIKYVKKLHEEHGYVFHVITSQTNDEYAQHLRIKNLCELFGPSVFEKYVFLDTGADKNDALTEYAGTYCYWLEDKIQNAYVGQSFGLESLLMDHPFNKWAPNLEDRRVKNWKEIYERITGEE